MSAPKKLRELLAEWRERSSHFVMQNGNPAKMELEDCADDLQPLVAALEAKVREWDKFYRNPNQGRIARDIVKQCADEIERDILGPLRGCDEGGVK